SRIVKNGHLSILEHNVYVFYVSGLSRVASHQLVRKRIASYSQQSQRYVSAENFTAVTPETINASEFLDEYNQKLDECSKLYQKMVDGGVPKEDARFILPGATTTQLIASMNAHSLVDFFVQRLCVRSQWEIRRLAELMLEEVKKVSPLIFKDLGAYCDFYGYCPEIDQSCGRIPTLDELKSNKA
ncbi:MAG: FAD-dependent thymidylate synthase, partial [Candidatus Heimdallarchaeaceae archaeon]